MFGRIIFASLISLWLCMVPAQAETLPSSRDQITMSFAPLVKQTAPAVVNIYTSKLVRQRLVSPFMDDPIFQQFFGVPEGLTRQRMENSLGSGVILRQDGLVATSAHVVQGADEIRVVLHDRREFAAQILNLDEKTDLAMLRLDGVKEALPALELADSDAAEVGDLVMAIGNPFGVGQTVTTGIISGVARSGVGLNNLNSYIQTDAAINPGNSGGALVGMDGKLLGINAAIFSKSGGYMGIGFAVPAAMVRAVLQAVEQGKTRIVRPWLGLRGQDVTAELASSLGLARPTGIVVRQMSEASPLAIAGLRVGDVIEGLNGRSVEDEASLRFRVGTLPVGGMAELTVVRGGVARKVAFQLIAPPEVPARQETIISGRNFMSGIKIGNLSPAVAEELGMPESGSGVVVLAASNRGVFGIDLQPGDRLVALNGQKVANVNELLEILQQPARRWQLQLGRGGQLLNILVGG